jgi:hypothetical protein
MVKCIIADNLNLYFLGDGQNKLKAEFLKAGLIFSCQQLCWGGHSGVAQNHTALA